jgi:hypothetical protein
MPEEPSTPTLMGLGPLLQGDLCSACRMLRDAPKDNQLDIAFCYGIAMVYFRGAEATSQDLCGKHRGMVSALVREARRPRGEDY